MRSFNKLKKRRLARELWPDMDAGVIARMPIRRIALARARAWRIDHFYRDAAGRLRETQTGRFVSLQRAKHRERNFRNRQFRKLVGELCGLARPPRQVLAAIKILERVGEKPRSPKKRKRRR